MGEPLGLQDMFFGTMAGAAIVLMGASYALFFALGRLHGSRSDERCVDGLLSCCWRVAAYVLVDALALERRLDSGYDRHAGRLFLTAARNLAPVRRHARR